MTDRVSADILARSVCFVGLDERQILLCQEDLVRRYFGALAALGLGEKGAALPNQAQLGLLLLCEHCILCFLLCSRQEGLVQRQHQVALALALCGQWIPFPFLHEALGGPRVLVHCRLLSLEGDFSCGLPR